LLLRNTERLLAGALRVAGGAVEQNALVGEVFICITLAHNFVRIVVLQKQHYFMKDAAETPYVSLLVIE